MKLLYKAYTYFKYRPGKEVKSVFKNFPETHEQPEPTSEIKNKKILFCPFAPHHLNIIREGIWAHACKLRGAEVKMLTYDLFLDAIDFINPNIKKDLSVSYKISKKLYNIIKLPYITMSSYFNKSSDLAYDFNNLEPVDIENLNHKGIVLGDLVIASSVRYFFCNGPEWDNPEFLNKARQFARSAVILTDIFESILLKEKPDKIVSSHGIYVSWGTLFRMARKMNIPIDIYGASYRKNTLRFYHNAPNAPFPVGEWNSFKNIELSKEETNRVDEYFASRSSQSQDSVTLFTENSDFPDSLNKFITKSKADNKKLFCLFSNISWDAYMFKDSTATFSSMTEWLSFTIKQFLDNTNHNLIIKAHPAEKYFKVNDKYCLRSFIPKNLTPNIFFIDNDQNVKSFDLYPLIDIGLTYLSTVSIEMAMNNIPVITAGIGGQYSNKGFTIDPNSKNEYFSLIDGFSNQQTTFVPDLSMAKKYMYFRFFREAIGEKLIDVVKYKVSSIKLKNHEDLIIGKDTTLDIICEGFLNDKPFINI